jgi:flagellar hook protein FlgE
LGDFAGVEIDRDGFVYSMFTNGESVPSFKIPLAHFVNVNGLERISGTAFAETENSGIVTIFDSGQGGTGLFQSSSLENSNVDLANEFSLLVVNQRAFSLNSKLISAIDEMTQLTSRLKR